MSTRGWRLRERTQKKRRVSGSEIVVRGSDWVSNGCVKVVAGYYNSTGLQGFEVQKTRKNESCEEFSWVIMNGIVFNGF